MPNNYDQLAPFYDLVVGDRSDEIKIIRQQIKRYSPTAVTVLELGCGTGSVLAGLASHYEVAGIDKSANMLKKAQQKLPKSLFKQADITSFKLNKSFDVIICVFDTINHLDKFEAWQKVFELAHDHLAAGGLLVFDVITTGRIKALGSLPPLVQTLPDTTVELDVTPSGPNSVDWYNTIQDTAPDGTIQVYEDHARETAFPLARITDALSQARFSLLTWFDSDNRQPDDDSSDRVYFVCQAKI